MFPVWYETNTDISMGSGIGIDRLVDAPRRPALGGAEGAGDKAHAAGNKETAGGLARAGAELEIDGGGRRTWQRLGNFHFA